MFYQKLFLVTGLFFLSFGLFSQSDCQDDMDKANKLFDDGKFREAEKVTKSILETCSLNKTQENEMLKLIASIYFEMDELELAEEYVAQFVKKNPYYVSSKRTDPFLFRNAVDKVKSFPRFSIGIKAGLPSGLVSTEKVFPIFDSANYFDDYAIRPIIQGGIEFSLNISSHFSVNLGSGLRFQELRHQLAQYNQIFFHYKEQNISSNFPISLGYTLPLGRAFDVKTYLGGEVELFVQSKYSYDYTSIENISEELTAYLKNKRNNVLIRSEDRAKFRYAGLGGIKLSYRIERFSIFADARYIRELVLYNKPKNRYTDPELYLDNNYVMDDIKLENLDFSLGLMYNFSYKVKSKYE
jgi:hypothetical protein